MGVPKDYIARYTEHQFGHMNGVTFSRLFLSKHHTSVLIWGRGHVFVKRVPKYVLVVICNPENFDQWLAYKIPLQEFKQRFRTSVTASGFHIEKLVYARFKPVSRSKSLRYIMKRIGW